MFIHVFPRYYLIYNQEILMHPLEYSVVRSSQILTYLATKIPHDLTEMKLAWPQESPGDLLPEETFYFCLCHYTALYQSIGWPFFMLPPDLISFYVYVKNIQHGEDRANILAEHTHCFYCLENFFPFSTISKLYFCYFLLSLDHKTQVHII